MPSPGAGEAFLLLRHDLLDEPVEQCLAVHRRGVRGRGTPPLDVIGQALLGGLLRRHLPQPFRRSSVRSSNTQAATSVCKNSRGAQWLVLMMVHGWLVRRRWWISAPDGC